MSAWGPPSWKPSSTTDCWGSKGPRLSQAMVGAASAQASVFALWPCRAGGMGHADGEALFINMEGPSASIPESAARRAAADVVPRVPGAHPEVQDAAGALPPPRGWRLSRPPTLTQTESRSPGQVPTFLGW